MQGTGIEIFNWLVGITSSSFFMVWLTIAICSFRFRTALKVQKDPLLAHADAYRTTWWPVPPAWLFCGSMMLLVCCMYLGLSGGSDPTAYNFFQYNLGVILILGAGVGYKLIFRTPFRQLHSIDLITGRARISESQKQELEAYRAMPRGKRFLTYIQLW
jgi:yeast amino acid transporter